MAVVVAHDRLLILPFELGVQGEADVHRLLVGAEDVDPGLGVRL